MQVAYDKACEEAKAIEEFVAEHPVATAVIVLGILVLVAPYVLEALGFAKLGPVEGEWVARFQGGDRRCTNTHGRHRELRGEVDE